MDVISKLVTLASQKMTQSLLLSPGPAQHAPSLSLLLPLFTEFVITLWGPFGLALSVWREDALPVDCLDSEGGAARNVSRTWLMSSSTCCGSYSLVEIVFPSGHLTDPWLSSSKSWMPMAALALLSC